MANAEGVVEDPSVSMVIICIPFFDFLAVSDIHSH